MNTLYLSLIVFLTTTCLTCNSTPVLPKPQPVKTELEQRIDSLIAQLGANDWQEREQAQKELEAIGTPALDALSTAMETSKDPEIKIRSKKLIGDIQWLERVYNLPKTFGERYYAWIKGSKIIGYIHLIIQDAEYEGQPAFKVTSKWLSNDEIEGEMYMTTYTKKDKYLSPISEEVKIISSEANFDFKMKVKDSKGSVAFTVTKLGIGVPFNQTVDIPDDLITWETGFILITTLPMNKTDSYPFSLFMLCATHGFEPLSTTPIRFIDEEEISYRGNKVKCNKFSGEFSGYTVYGWMDKDRNALKIKADEYDYQFILTDKEDAIKIFNLPEEKHPPD